MFSSRYLVLFFGWVQFAGAQTVVNSTFVNPAFGYGNYNEPNNWNPAEVPNNTATKVFNVNIATFFEVQVTIDATISNLHLGSATGLAVKLGKTFTVAGSTTIDFPGGLIDIESYAPAPPSKFDAGTLSAFSDHTLRGEYVLEGSILQFRGADVWNLRGGGLRLSGPLSAVVDEAGNDALRNLALVDSTAQITLQERNFVTNAPFLNEGSLSLWSSTLGPSTFTATAGLKNFDAVTRTLSGGRFDLGGGTLRFDGADVVNLASTVYLASNLGLTDLAGNDGFRNLAHILPTGVLSLGRDFTSVGSFSNDGQLAVNDSAFTVTGALNNFDASSQTLTGGTYSLTGGVLKFSGADIVHNGASIILTQDSDPFGPHAVGRITDLNGNDALRNFRDNLPSGSFTLSPGQLFVAPGNFTNAGTVTLRAKAPAHDNRAVAEFRVPPGSSYNQTGGATANAGRFTADNVNVAGGTFFNRGRTIEYGVPSAGGITGNLNISGGVLVPDGAVGGNLSVGGNGRFHPTIGRFTDSILVQGSTSLGGTLEVELTGNRFPANSEVITVLQSSGPITGTFSNAANGARIQTTDGGGSFVVVYETNAVKLTQFELSPAPAQLLNISTRAALSRTDNDPFGDRSVLIAGFIISGSESKKVVVRGIGPSLAKAGVSRPLADPTLELHGSDGSIITTNNDWRQTQQAELTASGLAPEDDREAAVLTTLAPGTYTVVIREASGSDGTGLVEVYDISGSSKSKLANISTRGFTDDRNPLIGGIIAGGPGNSNAELVVRALGPSLHYAGVADALNDLTLELRDANGNVVGSNQEVTDIPREVPDGLSPVGPQQVALRVSVARGNYTALLWAKPDQSGIALVEFYDLRP